MMNDKKYHDLLMFSQDIFYRTDLEGRIVLINHAVKRVSGYTVEEATGMKMAEEVYLHSEDRLKLFQQLAEEGSVEHFRAELVRKDGSRWWGSTNAHFYRNDAGEILGVEGITRDITQLKKAEDDLEALLKKQTQMNKSIMDSIHYASLIQNALLPEQELFDHFFEESFYLWTPKDVVGGDIILLDELSHSGECVLMLIDCTGHGVPGAFVTMLVKAIEQELVMQLKNAKTPPSPAHMLQTFNQNIRQLLKQDTQETQSNVGFDGAILCYNKAEQVLRFAGAGSRLYHFQNETLNVLNGNKQSVGYTNIDSDYTYSEQTLCLNQETQVYLTTDGYLDQPGGKKGLPFGRKRFQSLLQDIHLLSCPEQKKRLLEAFNTWRGDQEQVDDVSLISLKLEPSRQS